MRLSAVGDGLGVVIDPSVLEALKLSRDTELELLVDGERLIIQRSDRRARLAAAADRVMLGVLVL